MAQPVRRYRYQRRASPTLEIICRKRYPFASAWQRFLLYRLQNSALAKLEGEHQLFWGLVRSTEFFAVYCRSKKSHPPTQPFDPPFTTDFS
ncbi:hypothetical protein GNZ12_26870 [Paraburkholderia sp. 1N]|uniref:Uncharacterized protein n=1 Tax=Paraburkholderia solitsugae TaxID=2675748 RepID=A0ABX2BY70_9BURK|nr:hypothetical protein [Paraburkholderia solitsugae]NPT44875.1 hypothetical protein [Paraburkholderia solitsugae]